jgi:hypothetical protein
MLDNNNHDDISILVTTLTGRRKNALKMLKEIPNGSIVCLPERHLITHHEAKKISREKDLFIIYNQDTKINGKCYVMFHGIDNGEIKWSIPKFKLWHTDLEDGYSAGKPQPIQQIRGHIVAIFICYEIVTVAREGRLLPLGHVMKDYDVELLMITANWEYNFGRPIEVIDTCFQHIPTLKLGLWSNTRKYAYIRDRNRRVKLDSCGWKSITINDTQKVIQSRSE